MRKIIPTEHGSPDVLEITEASPPEIGENGFRIRMKAGGVNYTSVEKRRGTYHGVVKDWEAPYATGLEGTGVITETGEKIEGWKVGDRVGVARLRGGTWQSQLAVTPPTPDTTGDYFFNPDTLEFVFKLPEGLSYREGAAIPVSFLTAYGALFVRGDVSVGDNVLIHSVAGGVGSAAVQLMEQYDVTTFGLASSEEKLEFASSLGLDHPIQYTENETAEEVTRILGDSPIDLALDSLGGGEFKQLFEIIATGGTIVTYGVSSGTPGVISTPKLIFSDISVHGFHLTAALLDEQTRSELVDGFHQLLALFDSGSVRVTIDELFGFDEVAAAHEHLQQRNSMGKVILDIDL